MSNDHQSIEDAPTVVDDGKTTTGPPVTTSAPVVDLRDPTLPMASSPAADDRKRGPPPFQPGANAYSRYHDFRVLGIGGVGTVSTCVDPNLGRKVALKTLNPELRENRDQRARFVREARAMAQLEHPNIVPVHELGVQPDGSVYFTMKRVRGISLNKVFTGLREGKAHYLEKFNLPMLLDIFVHVCQGVAFAHSRGVLHRDLKPHNIHLGTFGEVLVMDWGLVKLIGQNDGEGGNSVDDGSGVGEVTMDGSIAGTPLYMAPEQVLGEVSSLDGRSDVYSLGCILYEMLTLKRTATGSNVREILDDVVNGERLSPRRAAPERHIPVELDRICMKALAKKREDRYPSVRALTNDIENYRTARPVSVCPNPWWRRLWKLALRRPAISSSLTVAVLVLAVGMATVASIRAVVRDQYLRQADRYRREGNSFHEQKQQVLAELAAIRAARTAKVASPREQELAARVAHLDQEMERRYSRAEEFYNQVRLPPERRAALDADVWRRRLEDALASGDYDRAATVLDRVHVIFGNDFETASPVVARRFSDLAAKVQGEGSLAVDSSPSGATVRLYLLRERRLVDEEPMFFCDLGASPVAPYPVAKGSYLLRLDLPGRPTVFYPVHIGHAQAVQAQVRLPGTIPAGMTYVPGGPFLCGGDQARFVRLHEASVDGFFIKTAEVTFAEYLEFWRATGKLAGDDSTMALVRLDPARRRFDPAWDADGNLRPPFRPDLPVVGITHAAAEAYCAWLGTRLGRPVRLPTAGEWEKAARGVDGRKFPWGNAEDPGLALTLDNTAGHERFGYWAPPGSFPADRSVYGVLDMGGNVREWTASRFPDNSPDYQIRGASGATTRRFLDCAYASDSPAVPSDVGFRYVMPLDPDFDDL